MQYNILVNLTGLEGHAMPIDINMEHLIGQLKITTLLKRDVILSLLQDLLMAKGLECGRPLVRRQRF